MGFKLQESESISPNRLVIKTDGRFLFLDQNEILWLEAEGNCVQIHTNQNPITVRSGISALEKELAPNFIRISRSTIVNLNHVREMRPCNIARIIIIIQKSIGSLGKKSF